MDTHLVTVPVFLSASSLLCVYMCMCVVYVYWTSIMKEYLHIRELLCDLKTKTNCQDDGRDF